MAGGFWILSWAPLFPSNQGRVPHISLVVREMWDTLIFPSGFPFSQVVPGVAFSYSPTTVVPACRSPKGQWLLSLTERGNVLSQQK
jgi:hypothetical protein